jgi:hypothetical protein
MSVSAYIEGVNIKKKENGNSSRGRKEIKDNIE